MDVAWRQHFLAITRQGDLGCLKLQVAGFAKVLPGEDGWGDVGPRGIPSPGEDSAACQTECELTLWLVADQIWGNWTPAGKNAAFFISQGLSCSTAPARGCWGDLAWG